MISSLAVLRERVRDNLRALDRKMLRPVRIYVAGPMTGIENHNFPAFRAAAAALRAKGFEVASPLEINAEDAVPDKSWAECMRADLRELVGCDCVALLPGWNRSRGALLEHYVAENVGIPCHPIDHYLKQTAPGRPPANLTK